MTDRINALVVILEKDIREDDVESLVNAIRHFRFVADVKKNVSNIGDMIAYTRSRRDLTSKILDILHDDK